MKHNSFFLRSLLLLALLSSAARATRAQSGVGIGTTTPDASAALDIVSTDKGLLVPRVATASALASPATGLLVYQTTAPAGFYYNAGTPAAPAWTFINPVGVGDNLGNHTATQPLNLQANALVGNGASISGVGVGVRADGGLNIGQNMVGNNFFLGYQAGQANSGGVFNQLIGYKAGQVNTTGSYNHFNGFIAGQANTTGSYNQFNGYFSGFYNTTGNYNQFSGYQSGAFNTTGSENQFTGFNSGVNTTTGNRNQFTGYSSGFNNSTGSNNFAFGYLAGPTTGNLTNAGAIGYQAQVSQSNSLVLGGTGSNAVKVGIATTAPTLGLDVASGTLGLRNQAAWDHLFFNHDGTTAYVNAGGAEGGLALRVATGNTGTYNDASQVYREGLRLLPDGRLGVGTNSPAANYRTTLAPGSTTENGLLVQLSGNSTAQSLKLEHNGSNLIVRPATAGGTSTIVENTGGGSLLLNPTSGNVGIGTPSAGARLDVNGNVRASGNFEMGYQTVSADYNVPNNFLGFGTLPCPAGKRLIGGGGGPLNITTANATSFNIIYNGPDESAPNTTWSIKITNTGPTARTLRVYCNCARVQ